MALLSNLEAYVISDGNYDWNDVFNTLDDEVLFPIFNGDTTVLTDAIAAEFPLLTPATTIAAVASDVADITAAVNGAASIASAILSDGSVAMAADLDLGSNSLTNVAGLSGSVFINDNTMASASATNIPSALSVKTYVDNAVDSATKFQGSWDASSGSFPGGGTAQAGDLYKVSVAGTVDSQSFDVGDSIYAEVDNASTSTYSSNWIRIEGVVEFDASQINLTAGYAAAAGTVAASDPIETAIAKLDGNIQGLITTNVAEGTNLYFTDARSIASPLTGFTSGAGTITAADSILQAIQKLDGNIGALVLDDLGDVDTTTTAPVADDFLQFDGTNFVPVQRVYGTEFQKFESNGVTTTSSNAALTNKISGTTTNLPAGDYQITISYSWNHQGNANDFIAEASFDGANLGQAAEIHRQEPKDSAGNFSGTGSNQKQAFTKIYYVTVAAAGAKAVSLDFGTETNGQNSSMWDANYSLIRVA